MLYTRDGERERGRERGREREREREAFSTKVLSEARRKSKLVIFPEKKPHKVLLVKKKNILAVASRRDIQSHKCIYNKFTRDMSEDIRESPVGIAIYSLKIQGKFSSLGASQRVQF